MSAQPLPPGKPKNKKFARRFQFLLVLIIFIALAYSGAWLFGAQTIRAEVETALAPYATPASETACGNLDVRGFPFRYDVTCTNLSLTEGDIGLAVPEIKATVLVYRPAHIQWFAEGPATYTDAFSGARGRVSWDDMRGSARSNGWALARISVEGNGFVLTDTLVTEREIGRVAHVEAHALDSPEKFDQARSLAEIALYAGAEGVDLNQFDIAEGRVRLEAEVPGLPGDLRHWSLSELVNNWHEDPVRLVGLHAADTKSEIDIVGTLGTTADAYLTGDFDLTTKNVYELLSPTLPPVLLDAYLGQKNQDGTYYRSYAIRDGVIMAGNIPVLPTAPLL